MRTQPDPLKKVLTPRDVLELPGPDGKRGHIIHYDGALPGFGLRVTKAGARSFVLNYRADGIERRITLGSIAANATQASLKSVLVEMRAKATHIKGAAKYDGRDVLAERKASRERATVADLAERYLETHAPKKRASSQKNDKAMIDNFVLPALKNRRVEDVEFEHIDALHRKISKDGSPIAANRVVSLLSKMFSLAIKWKLRSQSSGNPAKGIERNPEEGRRRYLTRDELKNLGMALAAHRKKSSANAVRLLLLTGARRGEVLGATWDQFDLDAGVWTKPSAHTKQKKEHRVPISGAARLLLVQMREDAEKAAAKEKVAPSPLLFIGPDGKPQSDLKHFWAGICEDAGITGVRIHDLRHTYASVLASAGQTLPVIGQLLGHTNPNTTARYAHLFDDPLRAATERAASVIESRTTDAEIIQFEKRSS